MNRNPRIKHTHSCYTSLQAEIQTCGEILPRINEAKRNRSSVLLFFALLGVKVIRPTF